MLRKPTYEELEERVKELEHDNDNKASEIDFLRGDLKKLKSQSTEVLSKMDKIQVLGINIEWDTRMGTCFFENLPVAMMWVDTTLAGLMSGVQSMVGTERFGLALQSEGRKSVVDDWKVISRYPDFKEGFKAIANIAAVAGWGDWKLISIDRKKKECRFQVGYSWEGLYQKALGVCWGSGMLAGKMAGYCTRLFSTDCWADQAKFIAEGDQYDEFVVKPSDRSIENEIENLLAADEATRADMAVALQKLQKEADERIRAEGALRKSEEKYRLLIENIPSVTWVFSENGETTFISPNVEKIYGFSQKEIYEKGEAFWFGRIHPEDIGNVRESFKRVFEEGMKVDVEYRIQRKDGKWIWIHDSVIMAYEEYGVRYAYGILSDITGRKKAEEELHRSRDELELRVKERTADLEKANTELGIANKRLEELNRELRDFAYVASHDLREPLRKIGVFGDLLAAKWGESLDETAGVYLRRMQSAAARMSDLLDSLLAYSRVTTMATGRKETDLGKSVETALSNLEIMIEEKDARLEVGELPTVKADQVQMVQLFQNLIANALKFQPKGGTPHIKIWAQIRDENRACEIRVQDNGIGFEEKLIGRIFLPFQRLHGRGSGYEGMGMGLAICKKIVERHGGKLTAKSTVGKGSTFIVTLPLEGDSADPNHHDVGD